MSVGGLLALDQVLREYWSCLTTFGTLIGWSKKEHPGRVEITGYHLFCRVLDPTKGFREWKALSKTNFVGLCMPEPVSRILSGKRNGQYTDELKEISSQGAKKPWYNAV